MRKFSPVRLLSHLVLMLAVLLMPFGMASASAVATHHAATAEMPMGHCPADDSKHDMKGGISECTMACAAALPAVTAADDAPALLVRAHITPEASHQLAGLHPETAIPPPKSA